MVKESVTFQNWLVNEGKSKITLILYILAQLLYFAQSYYLLQTTPSLTTFRGILGQGLGVARGAANVINLNCALILFTVCRNLVSGLRSTFLNRVIPQILLTCSSFFKLPKTNPQFDKNITFHIWIAYCITFWAIVHTIAHYFNYLNVSLAIPVTPEALSLQSGPGWTGQIAVVSLFLIITSAVEAVRRKYFEMFWITHHLFVIFFGTLLMHGSFCFIKADSGDICGSGPTFWKWWVASGVFYAGERLFREYRGRLATNISKVVQHPSKVVELQFKKDSLTAQAGQYIFICCPEINGFEWHPFTLTSSPYEDYVSIHIRVAGDWTTAFAERLGCNFDGDKHMKSTSSFPYIMVDGGYGSASEDVFDYEAAVLVGAGIGVTPFASILKTIWYRYTNNQDLKSLKKVYFIWTCRDKDAFAWFQDLLLTLEEENLGNFLEIHSYLTGEFKESEVKNIYINDGTLSRGKCAITGLKTGAHFGRPNWESLFTSIRASHPGIDVGVFYCGGHALSRVIHECCNKFTDAAGSGTRFYYAKEHF